MGLDKFLAFEFPCHNCGVRLRVPLDADGKWSGPCSDCDHHLEVQVLPEEWETQRRLLSDLGSWPYVPPVIH